MLGGGTGVAVVVGGGCAVAICAIPRNGNFATAIFSSDKDGTVAVMALVVYAPAAITTGGRALTDTSCTRSIMSL
jgi:hypothetical protein